MCACVCAVFVRTEAENFFFCKQKPKSRSSSLIFAIAKKRKLCRRYCFIDIKHPVTMRWIFDVNRFDDSDSEIIGLTYKVNASAVIFNSRPLN